jgi:hypothetical protein
MHDAVAGWDTFYVIIGSSAAALTGLMFVVITLTAEMRSALVGAGEGVGAYASPTVVHFCLVLLIGAVMTSPGHTALSLAISMAIIALIGLGYMIAVLLRMRRVEVYEPVGEDVLWHVVLPLAAYVCLLACAGFLRAGRDRSLYFVGASALLLLYIGIHNAWDTATWMAVQGKEGQEGRRPQPGVNQTAGQGS